MQTKGELSEVIEDQFDNIIRMFQEFFMSEEFDFNTDLGLDTFKTIII